MIQVDVGSGVPPYEQIRQQYRTMITGGSLLVGTRLPTVRRLAADLGLAVNTVARAYRELESDGLVRSRGRAGTVVAPSLDEVRNQAEAAARRFADDMRRLGVPSERAVTLAQTALREQR
ncbi:GntR family transcriptional regulator [Microbacterium sp. M1A1_1b]